MRARVLLALGLLLPAWAYERWYWSEPYYHDLLVVIRHSAPAVVHVNDLIVLPAAMRASTPTGARVVMDLHEYAPGQDNGRWTWRLFPWPLIDYLLKRYAARAAATVTVNQTIADLYRQRHGLCPLVVRNAPRVAGAPAFRPTDPGQIKLVHHGSALAERRLELMIEAVARTDARFTLHFLLVASASSAPYVKFLETRARELAPHRVFFHPPVWPDELVGRLADFDIGLCLMPAPDLNHFLALPNKFFDAVAAGLAVCTGPSPEMVRLTEQFGFGVVATSIEPDAAAKLLDALRVEDIDRMKRKAVEARKVLNADREMGKLVGLYTGLVGCPAPHRATQAHDGHPD